MANKDIHNLNKLYLEHYQTPSEVLGIDHIDPSTKLYNICQLKSFKVETLMTELDKCQVLCALCHRKKSIKEQQEGVYQIEREKPPVKEKSVKEPVTK